MPLYEYACDHCDERFEVIRTPTDTEPVVCPSCNRPARKLLSGFSVKGCGEPLGGLLGRSRSSGCGGTGGG